MRARNIKPAFFKNEDLAGCSMAARLLAIGLWTLADREGKMEYRPLRIKAEIFPYDNVEIVALLDELARSKHIIVYSLGTSKYIQVPNFLKHQRPHKNELKSEIADFTMGEIDNRAKVESTCDQGTKHFALNPSSLNPECGMRNEENNPLPPRRGKREVVYSREFLDWWELYPRKDCSKSKAWEKYAKLEIPHGTLVEALRAFIEHHRRKGTETQYIPHASTWLNGRMWEADYSATIKKHDPYTITLGPRHARQ